MDGKPLKNFPWIEYAEVVASHDGNATIGCEFACQRSNDHEAASAHLYGYVNGEFVTDKWDYNFFSTSLKWEQSFPIKAGEKMTFITIRRNNLADTVKWKMNVELS